MPEDPPCPDCGLTMVDVEWAEVTTFGDREPQYIMKSGHCPDPDCVHIPIGAELEALKLKWASERIGLPPPRDPGRSERW